MGVGLLPLTDVLAQGARPQVLPGREALSAARWAMVFDSRRCREGCQDCILACHRVHNVPDIGDVEEEVKWIWTTSYEGAFPGRQHDYIDGLRSKPFVVLCNHCANPSCVRVCPTRATFKRSDGIVMMDYHRCIGCRYCMAACPYGARSFNFRDPRPYLDEVNPDYPTREKGVVEKCNFCAERLAAGIPPACVEACRDGALAFGDIEDPGSEVRKLLNSGHVLRRKPELGTGPQVYYIV